METKTKSKQEMKLYFIEEDLWKKASFINIKNTCFEEALQEHNEFLNFKLQEPIDQLVLVNEINQCQPNSKSREYFKKREISPKYRLETIYGRVKWLWKPKHDPLLFNSRIAGLIQQVVGTDYSINEEQCLKVLEELRSQGFQWALYADTFGYQTSISIVSLIIPQDGYYLSKVDSLYNEICRFLDWQERRQS